MFQVRFHGRGGQGAVTGAELLSVAAFLEGKHAQAFPSFGSERTGAPVMAFCRIDGHEIRTREPVLAPDAVVIQDATLLHSVEVFQGLSGGGFVLLNTGKALSAIGCGEIANALPAEHFRTVAATEIALAHVGRPMPNAALLGGLAALTWVVSLESVCAPVVERFGGRVREANIAAARDAYARIAEAPC